ncbi:MAG TPA: heptosyltransferase [Microscillaceae bacterium]|jgi:heptosyltransferase-2|nr:heptosyltransferase [Microscillaceae bacterium]
MKSPIFRKVLIIQTAFLGDVVLATVIIEKLKQHYPDASIDFMVRRGNEGLLQEHPLLRQVLVLDKKPNKYQLLWQMIRRIRRERYDTVINVQRFFTTGLLTWLSGATFKIGFDKNPLARFFNHRAKHSITEGQHEVDRNLSLISPWTDSVRIRPALYPQPADYAAVQVWQQRPYLCIAPTSVWFTKQFPENQWIKFIQALPQGWQVYLLGAPQDFEACENLCRQAPQGSSVTNLAGKLNLLQSAALVARAAMNFVNDSAPMHIASAMNAPTCAIFCSTIPAFGFGPLAEKSFLVQPPQPLVCRPCGLHGKSQCPLGHFNCAHSIHTNQLLEVLPELSA